MEIKPVLTTAVKAVKPDTNFVAASVFPHPPAVRMDRKAVTMDITVRIKVNVSGRLVLISTATTKKAVFPGITVRKCQPVPLAT